MILLLVIGLALGALLYSWAGWTAVLAAEGVILFVVFQIALMLAIRRRDDGDDGEDFPEDLPEPPGPEGERRAVMVVPTPGNGKVRR